jgi:hypothetical protein
MKLEGSPAIAVGWIRPEALASAGKLFDWLDRGGAHDVTPGGLNTPDDLKEVPVIQLTAAVEVNSGVDGHFLRAIATAADPAFDADLVIPQIALFEPRPGRIGILDAASS